MPWDISALGSGVSFDISAGFASSRFPTSFGEGDREEAEQHTHQDRKTFFHNLHLQRWCVLSILSLNTQGQKVI